MANTYYDSQLTAEEIEEVLEAINGILTQANNGKVLAINNGKIEARSVQWGGGSAVVQPLSVTQNGTYNPPSASGVDGYAPVTVNVGGGQTPGLPASVQADILASAYAGNFIDKQSLWGGFSLGNVDNISKNGDGVDFIYNGYASYDLGEADHSVTCYIVFVAYDTSTSYPRVLTATAAYSNGSEPSISTYQNNLFLGSWGTGEYAASTNAGRGLYMSAIAMCIDMENHYTKFYKNGIYVGQGTLIHSGRYIDIARSSNGQSYAYMSAKYVGIVDGVESESTIIANLQSLMSVFGISA